MKRRRKRRRRGRGRKRRGRSCVKRGGRKSIEDEKRERRWLRKDDAEEEEKIKERRCVGEAKGGRE